MKIFYSQIFSIAQIKFISNLGIFVIYKSESKK